MGLKAKIQENNSDRVLLSVPAGYQVRQVLVSEWEGGDYVNVLFEEIPVPQSRVVLDAVVNRTLQIEDHIIEGVTVD